MGGARRRKGLGGKEGEKGRDELEGMWETLPTQYKAGMNPSVANTPNYWVVQNGNENYPPCQLGYDLAGGRN